jgi:GDPmannose 4,6-dehydratase
MEGTRPELLAHACAAAGIEDRAHLVDTDPRFTRPAEVAILTGDATKARQQLGWKPQVDFPELVRMMVEHDLTQESAGKRP